MCAAALFTSQAMAAPLILATKSFTEQHILSAMTVQYLQKKGFQVQPQTNIATVISRNAMINKQIDMTWEYTGTSLIIFNHINKRMSPQESYETVKRLDAKHGLVWLKPADMNNTYAFAMQRKRAEAEHINTMSEMVAKIEQIRKTNPDKNWLLGLDLEFAGRSDGMKPLQAAYKMDLDRPQIRQMDPGLVYNAVRDGFVDAGLIYTTDGRVKGFDLKVLEDDKGFFPSYAVTPVVRKDTLEANPGLEEALNTLSAQLNNDVITELNKKVDIDHQSPQQHLWLVALAVGLAIIIGVPLGILIVRHRWLATPVLGMATIVLTIPSIALFGLMIPLFSLIGQGIGALPAITAVFLYSLLPIVRNTHTALDSLPPGLREAGRGIGMTFWQRLRWVEIPMALPVIFGGIRTAVVMNIGVMAIAAVIGAGGLGLLLLNGIGGSDIRMLIAGALMICLLAIVLDWLLHRLQVVLTPKGIR
ncbi:hypothetical protein L1887_44784 [Cichorium endivia]|nr:hypothetical protein L1887_44784 [Cichorium endivia]